MKKNDHLLVEEFNKMYSTTLSVLKALLFVFRISVDGLCFNPNCPFRRKIKDCYTPIHNRTAYLCRDCLHHFYPMVDSIMFKSHVTPEDWFRIIYKMLSSRNGVSAYEIRRTYGYSEGTIFRLMHAVRRQMGQCLDWTFKDCIIEIDGAGINTGKKGYSKHFGFKKGRGSQRKSHILVIRARDKRMKLYIIHSESEKEINRILIQEKQVDKSCLIVTDEYSAYSKLKDNFPHVAINHTPSEKNKRRWKDGVASTNGAEGIFGLLKRNIRGTHIHVSHRYLQNYLNECAFKLTYADEWDYGFEILIKSFGSLSEHYNKLYAKRRAA